MQNDNITAELILPEEQDLADLCDEELVNGAAAGNKNCTEELMLRYKTFVRKRAAAYFIAGADRDDLLQEGMIGLFKAIRDYKNNKGTSFKSFAELCVKRQIISAVKCAARFKHKPLNFYVSLNESDDSDEGGRSLLELLPGDSKLNPEEYIISEETYNATKDSLPKLLSPLELSVLAAYLEGMSYEEMQEKTGCTPKMIDNALQRSKHKLKRYLDERDMCRGNENEP